MIDKKLISKWLNEGLINGEQAKRMQTDVQQQSKEKNSNRAIAAISSIGAILLGISAILFIASNWEQMPDIVKVFLLLGSTGAAYYIGYYLKFQRQSFPLVGSSLLFLGALLFGASIILITQIYNINANSHLVILIWIIGILPLVYALRATSLAALASLLYFLWVGLFFAGGNSWWFFEYLGRFFIFLLITAAIALFGVGGLHYLHNGLQKIARTYRIASLKVLMFSLFLLTFEWFTKVSQRELDNWYSRIQADILVGTIIFSIIAVVATIIYWRTNKSETSTFEGTGSLLVLALTLSLMFYPSTTIIYTIVFNLLFAALTLIFIYVGYTTEKMHVVNLGMLWLSIFLIAKYFDWFWSLMDRSLFFLIGGLLLVAGSVFLEKKRREIKARIHE